MTILMSVLLTPVRMEEHAKMESTTTSVPAHLDTLARTAACLSTSVHITLATMELHVMKGIIAMCVPAFLGTEDVTASSCSLKTLKDCLL